MTKPHERKNKEKDKIVSYSFYTFTHSIFHPIYNLFHGSDRTKKLAKKRIIPGLIKNYLTPIGLAY